MKTIEELIKDINIVRIVGATDKLIDKICFDTREVGSSSLFVAVKGTTTDGHLFINQAVERGGKCVVGELDFGDLGDKWNKEDFGDVTYIQVRASGEALGILGRNFYDNPSGKIKLVGVTGTNGKTTIATLLYNLFTNLGFKCGLLSTIENKIGGNTLKSTHTTPDVIEINRLLSEMIVHGCEYCFMEVSSHAIVQNRIYGLNFVGGIFTNISHDHLDYHKTFKEYIQAKKMFFDNLPKTAFALTNIDDNNGKVMLQNTQAKRKTYSLQTVNCDFKAKINEISMEGINLNIDNENVWFRLTGRFNAYNLLAVYSGARLLLGEKGTNERILEEMSLLEAAQGRFSVINKNFKTVIIDYAHTPDAVENVLNTIHDIKKNNQKITTVIGCGGDRDKTKRPQMAKISQMLSDKVILTSDNPRSENPQDIISDMLQGVIFPDLPNMLVIEDRKQAIKTAIAMAGKGDIILIAGKGHEKYQEIKGVKYEFDDFKIAENYLNILN